MDFVRKNVKIFGALLVLIVLIVIFVGTFFYSDTGEGIQQPLLPSVDERTLGSGLDEFFANPGERWVQNDEDAGGEVPLLRAITKMPVAGASIVEKGSGINSIQYVRFTEHTKGHEYETTLNTLGEEIKISNETHTRIGDVLWDNVGTAVLTRYHDKDGFVVRSHVGHFTVATNSTEYLGRSLPGTVIAMAFSPDGSRLFYLVRMVGGSVGYVESVKTGARTQIWSSALTSLNVRWDTDNTILVYTKPSSEAEGAVWGIDPISGREKVLLAGDVALSPLMNPDGTKILYSYQDKNNKLFGLKVLDIPTEMSISLPLHTFTEKCAWGPRGSKYVYCAIPETKKSGDFLEKWYMGIESSSDVLWRIDTSAGVVKLLLNPKEEVKQKFDIVDVRVSPKEDYVLFRTLDDAVLWGLQLPQNTPSIESAL